LTTSLAKKCFGGAENAKPKHAIWCLITVSLVVSCFARVNTFSARLHQVRPRAPSYSR
jgi:hypothetical protein